MSPFERGRVFADRQDAGTRLAKRIGKLSNQQVVVLGLARGGVPVAREVAAALDAPLDVLVVRKLGAPGRPELAIGAIGEDAVRVLNRELVDQLGVDDRRIAQIEKTERAELERRAHLYRTGRRRVPLQGRTAVVVDDGIATGATARAGCRVARALGAGRIVLAVPVAPYDWSSGGQADELVTVLAPVGFLSVGRWYRDFSQTTDEEVIAHLTAIAAPEH